VKAPKSVIVPLIDQAKPITVVEVRQVANGFKVVSLAARDITAELASLPRTAAQLTLYEVPNLQLRVYGLSPSEGSEVFYTNYRDRFSLREPVTSAALLETLKPDAIEFERQFGERLKRERVVR